MLTSPVKLLVVLVSVMAPDGAAKLLAPATARPALASC